ncbi:hypothetical protein RQP46_007265 [Phenoliferia psychrophenolica]
MMHLYYHLIFATFVSLALAHGTMTAITDTSVIRNNAIASGATGPCGKTDLAGNLDVDAEMAKSLAAGVPTAAADGTVTMTIHQVNGDGAGPYSCDVDATGTGQSFVKMQVTQNVPGRDVPSELASIH